MNLEAPEKSIVRALDRGLMILVLLADRHGLTLSELADETGIPVGTVHRLLQTLQSRQFIEFNSADRKWYVGVRAIQVGNAYFARFDLLAAAQPVLEALTEQTGETSNLGIIRDSDLFYLFQAESAQPVRAVQKVGQVDHIHSSGIGKVLLADMGSYQLNQTLERITLFPHTPKTLATRDALQHELNMIRGRGWALDDEERHLGMRCIAAPVYDPLNRAIAGISISGPALRFPDEKLEAMSKAVIAAAQQISDRLSESRE